MWYDMVEGVYLPDHQWYFSRAIQQWFRWLGAHYRACSRPSSPVGVSISVSFSVRVSVSTSVSVGVSVSVDVSVIISVGVSVTGRVSVRLVVF